MAEARFCPVPFEEFRVSATGDVSICSPTRLTIPVVGNILRDGVEGAWNSEKSQAIRRSILDGSFRHCKAEHCPALQKGSLPSVRRLQQPRHIDIVRQGRTILPEGPRSLNLHYDVTCNLKCPTCRPAIVGLKGRDLERVLLIKDALLVSPLILGARTMLLCGNGDPFASRPHLEFLRGIDAARFRHLRIRLLTNGLLLTPAMWATFPDAHPLIEEVAVSMDAATPETYALNRGGNWARLMGNLAFVAGLRRDGLIRSFRLNFVVQRNNFAEMEAFVALGREHGCDRVIFQKLADAPNARMADFADRAVHLPGHPDHAGLLEVLRREALADPIVDPYTIGGLFRAAAGEDDVDPLGRLGPVPPASPAAPQPASLAALPTDPTPGDSLEALRVENAALRRDVDALRRVLAIFVREAPR